MFTILRQILSNNKSCRCFFKLRGWATSFFNGIWIANETLGFNSKKFLPTTVTFYLEKLTISKYAWKKALIVIIFQPFNEKCQFLRGIA